MNNRKVLSAALTVLMVICVFAKALPVLANTSGPVIYFADAGESPGSVYKVENGTESTYHTRITGRLYNFAFSPEGILYYSNANDYDLYKLEGGEETFNFPELVVTYQVPTAP